MILGVYQNMVYGRYCPLGRIFSIHFFICATICLWNFYKQNDHLFYYHSMPIFHWNFIKKIARHCRKFSFLKKNNVKSTTFAYDACTTQPLLQKGWSFGGGGLLSLNTKIWPMSKDFWWKSPTHAAHPLTCEYPWTQTQYVLLRFETSFFSKSVWGGQSNIKL